MRYALTIFLSAFLLFQVQPIIGRYVLPWFGGTPAVWTNCLLFFQVLLLLGYSYAHLVAARLRPRVQGGLHLAMLAASLAFLPIVPNPVWKPSGAEAPTWHILALLTATIGAPYLLLSSTGPLLQAWFAKSEPGRSPYRLYALSNVGSLLALVSYPFLVEPALRLGVQAAIWTAGYLVFALSCGWCAWRRLRLAGDVRAEASLPGAAVGSADDRPIWSDVALWLGLAAAGSVMLLATTNQMCQEVAVVPLLWVLPLALYLLSFILCFDSDRWYVRGLFGTLLAIVAPLACVVFQHGESVKLWVQIAVYSLTLFVCCMTAHGELVRAKPNPRYLTLFYLMVAAGGALGGVFVALVAPRLFHGYWEYQLGLAACLVLVVVAAKRGQVQSCAPRQRWRAWATPIALVALLLAALGMQAKRNGRVTVETSRNFYGVLRVVEKLDPANGLKYSLTHGRIEHGSQFRDPSKRRWATAYFGPQSGIALAIQRHPKRLATVAGDGSLRIGIVGLGAGTIATYGQAGDVIRYYEINPEVSRLAQKYFTFLSDTPATMEIILGDARIQLERELAEGKPQHFDLLVVDAFSSDAIPMHLLTRECAEIYFQHLKPEGLLALNISNRHLDLKPVVGRLAKEFGKTAVWVRSYDDPALGTADADWMIVTGNRQFLDDPEVKRVRSALPSAAPRVPLWTDDFGSLRQVLAN